MRRALCALSLLAAGGFATRAIAVALRSKESIPRRAARDDAPFLSIVVPARNEERQIEGCIRSLLAQRYPRFEVIAVDDCSGDGTAAILQRLAAENERLRVVPGMALPEGWIGKPWALAQGAARARGSWLLFTDADTLHDPLSASSVMAYARDAAAQFVSVLPLQRFESIAERIVLPTILWMIGFAIGSLDAVNDPSRPAAIFNGQYLLVCRAAYRLIGGHGAVRDRLAEDYELARAVKRDGRFRMRLAAGTDVVSTRMYRSFGEIWNGFSKNLYLAAENDPLAASCGLTALAALSPLPELLAAYGAWRCDYRLALAGCVSIALTCGAAEFGMRRSRFTRGSGWYLPVGLAVLSAIFLNSTVKHATGRVAWRGRVYGRRTETKDAKPGADRWKRSRSKTYR